ncbi:hypothetical protein [Nostoc foliaceum]|uniref:Uncharacterized protein n=1 Tax=Nostoc foliaceum FACHB-393 TaxID=2692915 RepID=A0ABR8IIS1_9NOSO|nr:hypothetical protein [Nostoc foliaceum]MBD2650400.1 hypothetical protein [Nostoc foliaceum FACHB-393]
MPALSKQLFRHSTANQIYLKEVLDVKVLRMAQDTTTKTILEAENSDGVV